MNEQKQNTKGNTKGNTIISFATIKESNFFVIKKLL